jgi:cytochrome P450
MSNLWAIHYNEKYWDRPEVFDPTRFLGSNREFSPKHFAFHPFGIGRRICLGEKLALADLFLITIRLLQTTSDYMIVLPEGEGSANLEPNPNVLFLNAPNPYKVMLKKK